MEEVIDQVIDERGSTEIEDKRAARDKLVWDNFRLSIFPTEGEKGWRHYVTGGMLPSHDKDARREDGRRIDVFDPEYVPCPAFVKIDKNLPFELSATGNPIGNVRRCNFELPKGMVGRSAVYFAQAHMAEEHFDDWKEVYHRRKGSKNPQGEQLPPEDARDMAPPMDSTFDWPKWKEQGKPSQADKNEAEIKMDEAKERYKKSKRGKESIAQINKRRQEKIDKNKGSDVDGSTSDVS